MPPTRLSPPSAVSGRWHTLGCAVLLALAGVAGGVAIAAVLEPFRMLQLNSVFSRWEAPVEPSALVLAALGITAGAAAIFARSRPGRTAAGTPIWLAGAGIGLAVAAAMWAEPDAVGMTLDPVFGEHEAWRLGDWLVYRIPVWLPVAFLLGAASLGRLALARRATPATEPAAQLSAS